MTRHTIKLLWLFSFLSCVAGYQVILGRVQLPGPAVYAYYAFFAAGILAWLYLTLRIFSFSRNLSRFVRRIISNEYEAGIKVSKFFDDEVSALSRRINELAGQLVVYDRLQRERISVLARSLDVVCHTVKDCVIIFDVKEKEFRFNPAAQAEFGVEQEAFKYEPISLRPGNAKFIGLLRSAVEKGSFAANVVVNLEIPVRETRRELVLSITPVKDRNEIVEAALIFF